VGNNGERKIVIENMKKAEEFLVLGQKADQSVSNQSVLVSAKKVRVS